MEEKERYIIDKSTNYYTNTIVDTKTNTYYGNVEEHIDLLNKQNKENQQLHDLPNKIVEEIKKVSDTVILWWSSEVYDYTITAKKFRYNFEKVWREI